MKMRYSAAGAVMTALLMPAPAFAEPVKTEAVIVSVNGNAIDARTLDGPLTVTMSPDTKIVEHKGLLNNDRAENDRLIPGLIFKVEGDQEGNTLTADKMRFDTESWRMAVATNAGTIDQFTQMRQAIIGGQHYLVRAADTVHFDTAKAALSDEDKLALTELARNASSFGDYRISILGFADPTGDKAFNDQLSERRAEAVSQYLSQSGLIEPARILAPGAMGSDTVAPGEQAPTTNAEARRVLVRVITPQTQLSMK